MSNPINNLDVINPKFEVHKLALEVTESKNPQFDIALIMIILQVIIELIKLLQKWNNTPNKGVVALKNPGLVTRLCIRRYLKQIPYQERERVYNNILLAGQNMSLDRMKKLYEEVPV